MRVSENPAAALLSPEALLVIAEIPRARLLVPRAWRRDPHWTPQRQGYLDLYSGVKGVAKAIVELGSVWAITFEIHDHPGQDLKDSHNRDLVKRLILTGAVFGLGAAMFSSSLSRAIRPCVRSSHFPTGLPEGLVRMKGKIEEDNDHADWLATMVTLACEKGICFWAEHPDSSFLWLLPSWQSLGAGNRAQVLRIDFCRLAACWRKRTRVLTSTHLAGQHLFCTRDHEHVRLLGWSKVHRCSWTKVAQAYPRKFSYMLAVAMLVDGGLLPERRRVDVAAAAFAGTLRVGEAQNPGPRRKKVAFRNTDELDRVLTVEASTETLGLKVWSSFQRFCIGQVTVETFSSITSVPVLLAAALEAYGRFLFEKGESIYLLRHLVTYVQRTEPSFRPHLTKVWQLISKWETLEPLRHRVPLPAVIFRAMVSVALSWSWFRFAGIMMIGFEGICRPGEPLAACRADLLLPTDLMVEDPSAAFMRIRNPKGKRRGIGSVQHVKITGSRTVAFLETIFGGLAPQDNLFPGAPASFRRRWDRILMVLKIPVTAGLTPASLRSGGAVKAYREDEEIARLMWRMRLKSMDTLQRYLQETGAVSLMGELPEIARRRIRCASALFDEFLAALSLTTADSLYGPETRPRPC